MQPRPACSFGTAVLFVVTHLQPQAIGKGTPGYHGIGVGVVAAVGFVGRGEGAAVGFVGLDVGTAEGGAQMLIFGFSSVRPNTFLRMIVAMQGADVMW